MRKILAVIVFALCASSVWAAPKTFIIVESTETYGDYTSLEVAINDNEGNLTGALGGSITFRCEGVWASSDSKRVTVHNYTTGVSSTILVTAIGDARTNGVFSQGKYRLTPSAAGGDTVTIAQSECRIAFDGIQIGLFSNAQYINAIKCETGYWSYLTIKNCYVYRAGDAQNYNQGLRIFTTEGNNYIYNNIFTGFSGTGNTAIDSNGQYTDNYVYNNTCVNNTVGIAEGIQNRDTIAKNNICYDNTTDYTGTFKNNSTNNLSKDGTAPAFNTYYTTATVTFQSGTYLIDSTDTGAKDLGADLSADTYIAFNTSINGLTRPQGTAYDIGASEVSQEAPPTPSALVPFLPQVMIWEN